MFMAATRVPTCLFSLSPARSRLGPRFRSLCCSVPCRSCVRALGNSCTGFEPTVRTGFLIDGQVGWNKGGSSEWDWAPVRDHTSLLILDL